MVFHPAYFGPIIQYVAIVQSRKLVFEYFDNFQKQTYRNRCYILGPNGKQLLSVPILHGHSIDKQKTKDVKIDNTYQWQRLHRKALDAAYSSSPFYEYYIEDFDHIFTKRFNYLMELNLNVHEILVDALELQIQTEKTSSFVFEYEIHEEGRHYINAKDKKLYNFAKYDQVFDQKHPFIPNLSMLDLLFNEGPNTLLYLENHKKLIDFGTNCL